MKKIQKLLPTFLIFVIFIFVYKNWFLYGDITGGDWPYFFPERLASTTFFPPAWNAILNNGLGGVSPLYSLQFFHQVTIFFSNFLHIPWFIFYKISWFGLFIFLSVFSAAYLLKTILPQSVFFEKITASLIFVSNTYILMVVGGGQMGVALAYSVSPLVLARFIKIMDELEVKKNNLRLSLVAGVVLAIQVMFDPRITYITILAVGLYFLFSIKREIKYFFHLLFYALAVPFITAISLHAFWIVPSIFFRINPVDQLGTSYSGLNAFKFFSFADFSHSISLLHPNWPDNIFGKTYFLRPEFLILPLVAFSALYLVGKNKKILFFSVLAIIGAFLAKGANEPFVFINRFLFVRVPGFILFRDPTKFYLLITLAYGMLISFSIEILSKKISQGWILKIIFILFWIFLIRQAFFGQLSGTFVQRTIPNEYVKLGNLLASQKDFFRVLWIPRQQRFSFISDIHPAIEGESLFNATSSAEVIKDLNSENSEQKLQSLSIKYLAVPYDSLGEIFLNNRKYDDSQYLETIMRLRKISWLKEIKEFGKVIVFELNNTKDHFRLENGYLLSERLIQPDDYILTILTNEPTKIIFAENYSPFWTAKISKSEIESEKTSDGFNSFNIEKAGKYKVEIYFKEKQWFKIGFVISLAAFIVIACLYIFTFTRN